MPRPVTIVATADIAAEVQSIGREGEIVAKTFPLDTCVEGVKMDYTWIRHSKGYGTPRHMHTFNQIRYTLAGVRQQDDLEMREGECGYFGDGVSYGPQMQQESCTGLILQFEGPSRIPYITHTDLDLARQRLIAKGGTFSKGVYTFVRPDGTKVNKDSHAACFEEITGQKMVFPPPRYDAPIIMKPQNASWVRDRKLAGVEHKHMGTFGEYRSGVRLTRLLPGAKIAAHIQEDAEILYLVEGSINYGGKRWTGGKGENEGAYMYIPPEGDVGEMSSEDGGTFFVISLPMLRDLELQSQQANANRAA